MPSSSSASRSELMLATAGSVPTGPGWALEPKWDGMRALARIGGRDAADVVLVSRNRRRISGSFPELTAALADALGERGAVLDGEIVALSAPPGGALAGPSFVRLQARIGVARPRPELLARVPVTYMAFDILADGAHDVTALAYRERRALLERLGLDRHPRLQISPVFDGLDADTALAVAEAHGLEGIVAKTREGRYRPGRQSTWVKTPLWRSTEALIAGWAPGGGRHTDTLGAVLLGVPEPDGRLRYIGHVGSGLRDRERDRLRDQLIGHETPTSPFTGRVPEADRVRWVAPVLVAEARFRTWTDDGRLRHPSWRGLRPDRDPAEVTAAVTPAPADQL